MAFKLQPIRLGAAWPVEATRESDEVLGEAAAVRGRLLEEGVVA